jgi:glycosyltransferase involved in cell wall biosynthesis
MMSRQFKLISHPVVITAYNAAKWIGKTLDGILLQRYPTLEVLVVDDGSTDNPDDIVRSYERKATYTHQDNSDQPVARNRGVRVARGNYIH